MKIEYRPEKIMKKILVEGREIVFRDHYPIRPLKQFGLLGNEMLLSTPILII
jgi:hypothetical protein